MRVLSLSWKLCLIKSTAWLKQGAIRSSSWHIMVMCLVMSSRSSTLLSNLLLNMSFSVTMERTDEILWEARPWGVRTPIPPTYRLGDSDEGYLELRIDQELSWELNTQLQTSFYLNFAVRTALCPYITNQMVNQQVSYCHEQSKSRTKHVIQLLNWSLIALRIYYRLEPFRNSQSEVK